MFSIIVNNYNYAEYLGSAIESGLAQGPLVSEVIVVDDGSTDDSLDICAQWARKDSRVKVVSKPNGGQLSAINAGAREARGEIFCFLDADDVYQPGYLGRLGEVYREKPDVDFAFCQCAIDNGNPLDVPWQVLKEDHDFGQTVFRTLLNSEFIGGSTSTLSFRRRLAEQLLPCPLESTWRIQADDVLVFGASVFGARKYYLAAPLVRYRVHGGNHWFNRNGDAPQNEVRKLRLISHYANALEPGLGWRIRAEGLPCLVAREFRSIPHPYFAEAALYSRMISRCWGRRKWQSHFKVFRHWAMRRTH